MGSSRLSKKFINPLKTKLDGVSPGWTLALIKITWQNNKSSFKKYEGIRERGWKASKACKNYVNCRILSHRAPFFLWIWKVSPHPCWEIIVSALPLSPLIYCDESLWWLNRVCVPRENSPRILCGSKCRRRLWRPSLSFWRRSFLNNFVNQCKRTGRWKLRKL